MRRAALALSLLLAALPVAAQQVSLNGRMGDDAALLVIDGKVRTLRVGQSHGGVKLVQVGDQQAQIEVGGQRLNLRLGADPVATKASSHGPQRIVLRAGSGGHFMAEGSINGAAALFMVDTGATAVSLSIADAERMGINYRNGRPVQMQTANGVIVGYLVVLDRVRIGSVEIGGVAATVAERDMPYVLLGNSFLSRFQMKRENDLMTLERRF